MHTSACQNLHHTLNLHPRIQVKTEVYFGLNAYSAVYS